MSDKILEFLVSIFQLAIEESNPERKKNFLQSGSSYFFQLCSVKSLYVLDLLYEAARERGRVLTNLSLSPLSCSTRTNLLCKRHNKAVQFLPS